MAQTTATAELPLLPFVRPTIDEATITAVADVLRSGWITSGPKVAAFEAALSEYSGGRTVRTFTNGTATMEVALCIAGIGPGDEVITTSISWVATSNVVLTAGAKPVFVDIDPVARNIDLDKVEAAITPRTKTIIPVYLSGLPIGMDRLCDIVRRHKLRVVEDTAQVIESRWGGKCIGEIGDLVSLSSQVNKDITTVGGGALVLNTPEEAVLAEEYRLQGVIRTGFDGMEVDLVGGKFNLTDVNAVIDLRQFLQLEAMTARRAALARRYFAGMRAVDIGSFGVELLVKNFTSTNWHMFRIVLPLDRLKVDRAAFMAGLKVLGTDAGVHCPPIHPFKLYCELGWKPSMSPVTKRTGRAIITLPMLAGMEDSDVDRVVSAVRQLCAQYQ